MNAKEINWIKYLNQKHIDQQEVEIIHQDGQVLVLLSPAAPKNWKIAGLIIGIALCLAGWKWLVR